jgi:septal ring factor EnvC (AmiA/AmiB activator)
LSLHTKILIILLTLSSIFLCGIVVTYVANSENYKDLYETEKTAKQNAINNRNKAANQLNDARQEYEKKEDMLTKEVASFKRQVTSLKNDLAAAEREKAELLQKVTDMASVVEATSQTAKQQTQLFKNAQDELTSLNAKYERQGKELDETVAELIAKIAIIDTLEGEQRRLEQEKHQLQAELDKFFQQRGRETAAIPTVAPRTTPAPPVTPAPIAKEIGLKGSVTGVDLKYSIVEISIGTAHGVREGMTFYITRGNDFVCEILVFYVDTEKAVGDIKRTRSGYQPKVGDNVSTNL